MGCWFEEDKNRYDEEISGLKEAGIEVRIDEEKKETDGILRLFLKFLPDNNFNLNLKNPLLLEAEFPDSYPYFRPEIFAPTLNLFRHQNPLIKNLCVLARPTRFWKPKTLLVDLLKANLATVIKKVEIADWKMISQDLDEQAEPISEYYGNLTNIVVLSSYPNSFESNPQINDESILDEGTFKFQLICDNNREFILTRNIIQTGEQISFNFSRPDDKLNFIRIIINEWKNSHEKIIEEVSKDVLEKFSSFKNGSWYRVKELPQLEDTNDTYGWLINHLKTQNYKIPKQNGIKIKNGSIDHIIGLTFPEQLSKGKMGWGWLILIAGTIKLKNKNNSKSTSNFSVLIPATRIGLNDYQLRIPNLIKLKEKTIAVVGLGSLGAPSVLEFARNGVEKLHLLDCAVVNPSATIRWPLGLDYAGLYKTEALRDFLKNHYPYVQVKTLNHRIGALRDMNPSNMSDLEVINNLFEDTSLVYDATAEVGINDFLSRIARYRNIPYISIEARAGVWGGMVMRQLPDKKKGCLMCLKHHRENGAIPYPPQDPKGNVQTLGCGDQTFIGASFELQNIAIAGVRLSVATLCREENGYPDFDWDVGVLKLVDENQMPIAPRWVTKSLIPHPDCPYCNQK